MLMNPQDVEGVNCQGRVITEVGSTSAVSLLEVDWLKLVGYRITKTSCIPTMWMHTQHNKDRSIYVWNKFNFDNQKNVWIFARLTVSVTNTL